MFKLPTFICECCGKEIESWPALTYSSPSFYNGLSEQKKTDIAELSEDFCTIRHPEQTDRFIRCTLTQKVIDHCEDLEYGLWVSLSEKSFQDYSDNFNNEDHEADYFGWLCNYLPQYTFETSVPTRVICQPGGQRPEIIPNPEFDHPFVKDYYAGITKEEAERRILTMMGSANDSD
jgi:hypothetical protein